MSFQYIGKDYIYKDFSNKEITLEKEKKYNVTFRYEGPQVIINGHPVVSPDGTVWADFQEERISIPYAPQLLQKFWLDPSFRN